MKALGVCSSLLVFSSIDASKSMSKSNLSALNGIVMKDTNPSQHVAYSASHIHLQLDNFPIPEAPEDPLVDSYSRHTEENSNLNHLENDTELLHNSTSNHYRDTTKHGASSYHRDHATYSTINHHGHHTRSHHRDRHTQQSISNHLLDHAEDSTSSHHRDPTEYREHDVEEKNESSTSDDTSGEDVPGLMASESTSVSHRWSDTTLTGSFSGRCSTYSWGADEAVLDRTATEYVRMKFERINGALFEGKSSGTVQADIECKEWSTKFPHLEVRGIHLLDSMDDGTDMVAPDPFLIINAPPSVEEIESQDMPSSDDGLAVIGRKIEPKLLHNIPEHNHLHEEVIAADGVIEEYFAFDYIVDEGHTLETNRRSKLKRNHGLPPITPNACVRDTVRSLVFDQLWNEVITVLQPLIALVKENAAQARDSSYSLNDGSLTPTDAPLDAEHLQHQPYILRGLRDQPTLTKAQGQSGSQFLRFKYSTPNLPANLPQLTNNLSGVMQIRSVSLQQRVPSSYVPNVLPINDNSRETTPTPLGLVSGGGGRPESCAVGSRLLKLNTPLPSRTSDYLLTPAPPAPGPVPGGGGAMSTNNSSRLISSRMTNRRNINVTTLRPIERPKTPGALVPIDDGIRGFKLYANASHSSPPSTPYVRNTQLPPLEQGGMLSNVTSSSGAPGAGGLVAGNSAFERSPPTQLRASAQQQRNRVTFNSRIVSAAADSNTPHQDSSQWRFPRPSVGDLRPSTTTLPRHSGGENRPSTTINTLRHNNIISLIDGLPMPQQAQPTKSSLSRKGSDNSLHLGRMKVVRYATGFYGTPTMGGGPGVGGVASDAILVRGGGDRASASIAEDNEHGEEDAVSFTVTGKSGIFQSKPRSISGRTKPKSHIR